MTAVRMELKNRHHPNVGTIWVKPNMWLSHPVPEFLLNHGTQWLVQLSWALFLSTLSGAHTTGHTYEFPFLPEKRKYCSLWHWWDNPSGWNSVEDTNIPYLDKDWLVFILLCEFLRSILWTMLHVSWRQHIMIAT